MLIRFVNALLVDGSGEKSRLVTVTVKDDIILAIDDKSMDTQPVDTVIDVQGLILCPGFIDTHSHSDLVIMENPMVMPKLRQGVTTEILGQDGISMAPLPLEYISRWRKNIAGLEGTSDIINWDYLTTRGYLDQLQASGVGTNVAYLVPHGNVRMEVMGLGEDRADDIQLQEMCDVLQRELDSGGCGLSTGLIYPPCTYGDARELHALCTVAASNNVPLVIHQRSEADGILESMVEVLEIGRSTGVHVHFSHFKICGKYNSDKLSGVLGLLDKARQEGMNVTFDQYPYVAGSTMLSAILPPWAHSGGTESLLQRLSDPTIRQKIINEIYDTPSSWDNFVAFAGPEGIFVTNVQSKKNQHVIGKTLTELGKEQNIDPVNAAIELILEEENGVSMVDFYGLEEHVREFMLRPEMNVCTDGLMHGMPHPRTYGAFPRVLGKYARDEKLMNLEEAVKKMTLQPATAFGIEKRGRIAEGWFADMVIFDPEKIIDTGTFTAPKQYPDGVEMVMVNGAVAYSGHRLDIPGNLKKHPTGRVLR